MLGDGVYPHKVGGMEVFNYHLIKALKDLFDISYIANKSLDYENVTRIPLWTIKPQKIFVPLQLFFYLIKNKDVKVVLLSFSSAHWLIWLLEYIIDKVVKRKFVTVIHYGKTAPQEKQWVYSLFFHSQTEVVAVSDDIKKNYDNAFDINCKVLYPLKPFYYASDTIENYRKKYGIPQNATVICMVGSIKEMKHPETLIDAIYSMSEEERIRYNPFALYAGNGPLMEVLVKKADDLSLNNYIKFLSDFEGTSVSLLEAMFNKKQIIASRAPGIVEMVEDKKDALLFEIGNSLELKQRIIDVIDNPSAAIERAENAYKKYYKKYNYDNMIHEYINIFSRK